MLEGRSAGEYMSGFTWYFFEASVVDGLHQDDEIIQNEVFGPVITVQRFSDEDEMPHGGFKQSGYGKDLSMYGFEDYTRVKHVMSSLG